MIAMLSGTHIPTRRLRRLILATPLLFVAACRPSGPKFHNTDLSGASFGRDFSLHDHHGQQRTLADFRGKVVILFFGYTTCPDICPTMLARLADVMNQLGEASTHVQVLFVTLDPDRDDAARLGNFVPWFHPAFIGLRGNDEETQAVIKEFRVIASRKHVDSGAGYLIDHSTGAYVFDKNGHLRLYLADTASVSHIAADLRLLLAE